MLLSLTGDDDTRLDAHADALVTSGQPVVRIALSSKEMQDLYGQLKHNSDAQLAQERNKLQAIIQALGLDEPTNPTKHNGATTHSSLYRHQHPQETGSSHGLRTTTALFAPGHRHHRQIQ